MFTGIIHHQGTITAAKKHRRGVDLSLRIPGVQASKGGSIAVNGTCLTVIKRRGTVHTFTVMPETLRRTNLSEVEVGERVNIERPLKHGDPIDGHFVQGHVDTTSVVREVKKKGKGVEVRIDLPPSARGHIVPKGSVALDGVSLTVADTGRGWFSVALVPYTIAHTTLSDVQKGDRINIEFDILSKYKHAKRHLTN